MHIVCRKGRINEVISQRCNLGCSRDTLVILEYTTRQLDVIQAIVRSVHIKGIKGTVSQRAALFWILGCLPGG